MVGMPGRSGGDRPGAGRKPKHPVTGSHKAAPVRIDADDSPCFVYVIYESDTPVVCKIGVASDVVQRLSSMQTGTWRVLMVGHAVKLPSKSAAHAVERQVHQSLSALHCRGEWFHVAVDRAVSEVDLAASQLRAAFRAVAEVGNV